MDIDYKHWLSPRRIRFLAIIIFCIFATWRVVWLIRPYVLVGEKPDSTPNDFIVFWSASYMALKGQAADAYNPVLMGKTLRMVFPDINIDPLWSYLPPYYLVVLPIALLPYYWAYFVFMLITLCMYLYTLSPHIKSRIGWWCVAAFPGVWVTIRTGQNGFLTASIAASALMNVERKPALAGVLAGLLVIKPQLAFVFPVAFLTIGAWRSVVTAIVTAIIVLSCSTLIFGVDVLELSLRGLGRAKLYMEEGRIPTERMTSVFAALRFSGYPIRLAYIVHALIASAVLYVVWYAWRYSRHTDLRNAVLMISPFLVSPYAYDYDLPWLAFAIAWWVAVGIKQGWQRWEREAVVLVWLTPLFSHTAGMYMMPITPVLLLAVLWALFRRVQKSRQIELTKFAKE